MKSIEAHISKDEQILSNPTTSPQQRRHIEGELEELKSYKNNIKLDLRQVDSTGFGSINPSDMLVIDSYHHPNHMTKELEVHGKNVRKYIIAHDTSIINGRPNDALFHVLAKFAEENKWEIVEREHRNVGYTVLKKL